MSNQLLLDQEILNSFFCISPTPAYDTKEGGGICSGFSLSLTSILATLTETVLARC